MAEVVEVSAAFAPLAAGILAVLALSAAAADSFLAARADGRGAGRGLMTPSQEVARLMRQRRRSTVAADRPLWRVGGGGLVVIALLMVAVLPLGGWTMMDLPVGVVWFNAMDVAVWALVWLSGWGANSIYSLIGGYRFLALALAFELPLMFALTTPAVAAQSLRVGDIVTAQAGLWNVIWMPVAFAVYLLAVAGFSVWGPMSAPAATELAGGVFAELSGVDRLLLHAGRYALLAAGAAFAVPLFLGGGAGPLLTPWLWTILKTLAVLLLLVAMRRHWPMLRPERFAEIGWVVLLPAILVQLLLVSVIAVVRG